MSGIKQPNRDLHNRETCPNLGNLRDGRHPIDLPIQNHIILGPILPYTFPYP